jgi:ABC-type transport system substrate-binding protein
MLTKLNYFLVAMVMILLMTTFICTLSGCVNKNAVPTISNGSNNPTSTSIAESKSNIKEIHFIPSSTLDETAETRMLVNDQADMIPLLRSLSAAQQLIEENRLNVVQSEKGGFTIACIFFNMRRSPTNDKSFREAVSRSVNRDYLVNTVFKGTVTLCSTFVPPLSDDWTNKQATAPVFDTKQAAKTLDDAGYRFDKALKSRINPATNKPLHLTVLTPLQNTNSILWDIGYTITYYLNGLGIQADHIALPDYLFQPRAMQTRDFDILVQNVFLSQAPFGLYPLLHSSRDQDWTNAFSGIHDNEMDRELETLWSGIDLVAAQNASLSIQTRLAKSLPYVTVCSTPEYSVFKGHWAGIVSMPGIGASNYWTYQSVNSAGSSQDGILRVTAPGGFDSLNPLVVNSANEWNVLRLICSPLFYNDPVSMKDKPVLASKWDIEAWTIPNGVNGMKIIFHLVDGVTWQDRVPFTSQDIKFCIDFIKSHNVPNYKEIVSLVDNVQAPDKQTVEIYLKDTGYRYLYDFAWFTFMPQHIWKDVLNYQTFKPWLEENPNNQELTKLVGQGLYILKPGGLDNGVQLYRSKDALIAKP